MHPGVLLLLLFCRHVAMVCVVLSRFGQLQAVDVSGVPPAVHARDEGNVLRPDQPAVYPNR